MKEKWEKFRQRLTDLWKSSSTLQKTIFISVSIILLTMIIVVSVLTSTTKFVPLYSNLSIQEVGQIKEELDTRNVPYEIQDGGTSINVPDEQSDQLLVDLAGQGIPRSGNIDYSFFSENSSWGITDNEFNIMKLDAMQTELANLMKSIDGIEDAKVMINLPQESVFVSEASETATASIVLQTKFGYEFKEHQIDSLYHLVSRAIPDLPAENIVIRNQYLEYFDQTTSTAGNIQDEFTNQQTIKRDIERDIQKRLQQMLGVMVGMESVVVSVTTDIDFTQENRTEELVEPVDVDNIEGIPVSIESIKETFEGNQAAAGGVVGTGDEDIPNYPGTDGDSEGDYELVKDTVNYELNRIHKEIAETPYKLRDLGIQVVVNSLKQTDDNDLQVLSQQEQNTVEDGIASILDSMITTSIDKEYGDINPAEKVSIVFQEFTGRDILDGDKPLSIPLWMYIVGGALLLIIIILIILLITRGRKGIEEEEIIEEPTNLMGEDEVPELGAQPKSEIENQKEQLEKMAKEQPDDFAKLLRSWISED